MGFLEAVKNMFTRKKIDIRPGALAPEEVKKKIREIGEGKIVEIIRIGYDGEIDDIPLIVKILEIRDEYFIGKVVNPEREMIEETSDTVVYAKKGGGVIEYYYSDGDIKDIVVSHDEEILETSKNVEELKEIFSAIEVGDPVLICYWDRDKHGTINVLGILKTKDEKEGVFEIELRSINNIELEKKETRTFDINKDLIIDIQYAG
jgi:hypothetical protein